MRHKAGVTSQPKLYIRIEDTSDSKILLLLKSKLDENKGDTAVILVTGPDDTKKLIKLTNDVDPTDELLVTLREIIGEDLVKLH